MSPVLTREAIRALDDRQIEAVEVPEWGTPEEPAVLYVRGLSGIDRDDYEFQMILQKTDKKGRVLSSELNMQNLRAKLLLRCVVTSPDQATAEPFFQPGDEKWLGTKSGSALQRLFVVAQRLSGITQEAAEELTEELGKDQSGNSGSDLPSPSDTPLLNASSETSTADSSLSGKPSTESSPSEAEDSTSS